jgi:hypothetical protein
MLMSLICRPAANPSPVLVALDISIVEEVTLLTPVKVTEPPIEENNKSNPI